MNRAATVLITALLVVSAPAMVVGAQSTQTQTESSSAFSVTGLDAPTNVTRGDVVTVNATVENDGSSTATDDVQFRFDLDGDGELTENETLLNQSVSLDAGANDTVTFEVPTEGVPPGTYTHGVFTANDSETANITVDPAPANLRIAGLDAPANVTTGETVTVEATVENDGDEQAAQNVSFRFDLDGDGELTENETLATESVTVDGGANDTVTFEVSTEGVPPGTYTHGVFTDDDDATATITVDPEPVEFGVSNLSAPANVTRLETVTVEATVTNDDNRSATQDVQFRFDLDGDGELTENETLLNQSVSLDAGANDTVTFEVPTEGVDPGTYTHGVFTASDNETANITIEPAPATVRLTDLGAPANVTRGETVTVNATVENVGDEAGNATAEFRFDLDGDGNLTENETLANQSVSLDARANDTVTFEVSTEPIPPGTYTHGVVVDNESQTATIEIEPKPAEFTVENLSAPANVTQGDSLNVTAQVANVGDEAGDATVEFRFDFDADGNLSEDETALTESVTVEGGENETVTFDVPTDELPPGNFTHGVVVDDETRTATIDVAAASEGPNLAVVALDAPANVTREDTVTVDATLRNIGTESATQDVQFRFDVNRDGNLTENEALLNETLTVESAETTDVTFEVSTEGVPVGTYAHGVFTANDSETATITVDPKPANFTVSDLAAPSNVTRGDTVTVNATVENVGDVSDTQSVDFRLDLDGDGNLTENETVANQSVTLESANNTTVTYEVPTDGVPPGEYTHGVVTDNDSETATIVVEPAPASLTLSNLDAPATAVRGETILVTADVSNEGDETGNATAAFRVDLDGDGNLTANETLLEQSVSVEGRENATVAFEVPTGALAPGNYTHGVFVDDENQTAEIAVSERPTGQYFDLSNVSAPDTAAQGENVSVSATVTNVGNESGEDVVEVQLETAGGVDVLAGATVNLSADESESVAFEATIPENATPGEATLRVLTSNDSVDGAITVAEVNQTDEYTRDEIAMALFGQNASSLDATDAGTVEEVYLRQPFAENVTLDDVQTRDQIAHDWYNESFDALNESSTIEVQDAFDAQFGDTGENATYSRDEISLAKYGLDFDPLSTETSGQVTELYNRQPFAEGLDPEQVYTREEFADMEYGTDDLVDLTRDQRLTVESLFHEQFAD